MTQAEFKKRVQNLFKQQEKLLTQRNRKSSGGNGIYDRYELPVLTAAHAPITWRYDLDQKTNPFLMERIGVNAAFNAGAILARGQVSWWWRVSKARTASRSSPSPRARTASTTSASGSIRSCCRRPATPTPMSMTCVW